MEAPDEMGHQGSTEKKIQAIEYLDKRLIRIIKKDWIVRRRVSDADPSGSSHSSENPHSCGRAGSVSALRQQKPESHTWHYNEKEAMESGAPLINGWDIMERLFEMGENMLIVKKFGGTSVANKDRILMLQEDVSRIIKGT